MGGPETEEGQTEIHTHTDRQRQIYRRITEAEKGRETVRQNRDRV